MSTKGMWALGWLLGLGMLVLIMSCRGQSALPEAKAMETPTLAILIVLPNPTGLAATLTALPDRGSTMSASNAVTLTALARTPSPNPLASPPPNGTGIVPGKTDEAGVRALLGPPSHIGTENGSVRWSFNATKIPRVTDVIFEQGVVSSIEIVIDQPVSAESIVGQYGPPNLIGLIESSFPQESPSTSIHTGYMFYPSQGIEFFFDCRNTPDYKCHGIMKNTRVTSVSYFAPASIQAWLGSEKPERQYVLAPWSGFSEGTP